MTKRILVALTLLALLLWPAAAFAQHPLNIPDFCKGSPDTVAFGQTRVITGAVTIDCLRVETGGTLRVAPGATLAGSTIFGLPGARLEAGTEAAPITVRTSIVIRNTPLEPETTDPEQFGHGLIWFGIVRIHGAVKTPFLRTSAEPLAGHTALTLTSAPSGWQAGDRLLIPGTSQAWDSDESETPVLQAVSGASVTLQTPLAGGHRGARFVDGSQAFLPHVGNLTRTVEIRSESPTGMRGHVLFSDRADIDIRYAAFRDLGRTTTDPLGPGNQLGRYSLHLHHLFGPTSPQANGYQYTLIGNVVEHGSKWGITIHNTHYGLVKDNIAYRNGGAQIMTEDGSETGNLIEGNFMVGATGPANTDENQIYLGREQSGLWLRGPRNIIRNNVVAHVAGNSYVLVNASGPSNVGGIATIPAKQGANPHLDGQVVDNAQAPLAEWSGNEFYSTRFGVILWDLMASCCDAVHEGPTSAITDTRAWHVRGYGIFPYATNRLLLDRWTQVGDVNAREGGWPSFATFGDYLTRHWIVRRSRIEGLGTGVHIPIKHGDTRDLYGTAPGTTTIEDTILRNARNILSTMPYGVTGGGDKLPPRLTTLRRVTSQPIHEAQHVVMDYSLDYGPNLNAIVGQRLVAEDFNGQSFEVFYREQAPSFITPQSNSVPGLLGSPVAGQTNAQNWTARQISIAGAVTPCTTVVAGFEGFVCGASTPPPDPPQTGTPSVSTVSVISGPTAIPNTNQTTWALQSVESPNWDTSRWGTATHRFNVTVVAGSGPLPVFLQLHSAGNNGPQEPETFVNTTTPGIYVLPVDIGYLDGLADPVTGRGRFYSKWIGYTDAAGVYQPVTADRVVRYVRWVLQQSDKWTADPARVYVKGASMGGGGAMHVGALYPDVFAAIVSSIGWIDVAAWADGLGDCQPGVRWKTATGPLCRDVLDLVQRIPAWSGSRTPLYLTWGSNDTVIDPRRYPALLAALEAAPHGYQAEWRTDGHQDFGLAGEPYLAARLNAPPAVGTPSGTATSAPTGARTNLNASPPPTDPDTDGDGIKDSLDTCPGTPTGTPVDATGCPLPPTQTATITVTPAVRHQVMHRWEAGIIGSVEDWDGLSDAQIGAMLDLAVTDMGLTGARLAIRSGVEGPGLRYEIVNDNADPNVLNPAGFTWTNFDKAVSRWIVPARQRAQAMGEPFFVVLGYSDFGQSAFEHYNAPAEYAEFILAAFRHMQATYGFVPDAIDPINEPDNTGGAWTGDRIGACMVAVAERFTKEGLPVPQFVAPSVTAMPNADGYLNDIYAVPGAKALLTEVSYHRYNMAGDLAALAARAQADGKRMSMTEFWSPSTDEQILYQDVSEGRVSAWHVGVFGDAYGCQFGQTIGLVNGVATICPKNVNVRQYTRYVRPGMQRIGVSSQNPSLVPLAFISPDGRVVVVVKTDAPATFSIAGLPAGTYGVTWAGGGTQTQGQDLTVLAGQAPSVSIGAAGVLTVFAKDGGGPTPVDCVVSAWGAWSEWSAWTPINATTEQRTRTRTRSVVTPPSGGGAPCPSLTETETETRPIELPPAPVTTVTQQPNACRVTLAGFPPTAQSGWVARIRNMATLTNVGTADNTADPDGQFRPFVNSLTRGQTYALALRWTRSGSTAQTYPTVSVTVNCGG